MVHTKEELDELDNRIALLAPAVMSGDQVGIESAARAFMDLLCFEGWWRPVSEDCHPFTWSYVNNTPATPLQQTRLLRIAELVMEGRDNLAIMSEVPEACEKYLSIRGKLPARERGISWFDAALEIEGGDDLAATATVKRWLDSKKLKAVSIGKCPRDGRKHLYRLSDVLADLQSLMNLSGSEQRDYRSRLASKCRFPAEEKSSAKL